MSEGISKRETKEYLYAPVTRAWVIKQIASGVDRKEIFRIVTDADECVQRKLVPFDGTQNSLYGHIHRIPADELRAARMEFMADIDDIDLVHKKMRIVELVGIYDNISLPPKVFDKDKIQAKRMILQDIAKEVGEEAWIEAMKARGGDGSMPVTADLMKQVSAILLDALDDKDPWKH